MCMQAATHYLHVSNVSKHVYWSSNAIALLLMYTLFGSEAATKTDLRVAFFPSRVISVVASVHNKVCINVNSNAIILYLTRSLIHVNMFTKFETVYYG